MALIANGYKTCRSSDNMDTPADSPASAKSRSFIDHPVRWPGPGTNPVPGAITGSSASMIGLYRLPTSGKWDVDFRHVWCTAGVAVIRMVSGRWIAVIYWTPTERAIS